MNIQRILDTLWRRRGAMDPQSSEQDCAGDTSRAGEGARGSSRPASWGSAAPEPPSGAGGAPTDLCKRPAAPLLAGRPDTSLAGVKERGEVMTTEDRLLRRRHVEEITGMSRSSIYRLMQSGEFPRPVRVGPTAVRWRASDITGWLESRPVARSEVGPPDTA